MEGTKRKPQSNGALVRDPGGLVIGIWTEDGHTVLMTPELARDIARRILEEQALLQEPTPVSLSRFQAPTRRL